MSNQNEIQEFDRQKIYEKLEYQPLPENYKGKLPWIVQQQIAATNGKHYTDKVGKLKDYPIYELPVPSVDKGIMLDIGIGWGRWLVAGANKGYVPVGIDLRLEFCESSLATLKALNKSGYVVAADLKDIPFKSGVFDLVWSFSVIQHTHKSRLLNCLQHINRIINPDGYTFLEFPNKNGIKNRFGNVQATEADKDDYNSWSVRYYSINEYREIFKNIFGNFSYKNHSLIGIGILKEDVKYVSLKNKILSAISLAGSALTNVIPGLTKIADSLYIKAYKNKNTSLDEDKNSLSLFQAAHNLNPSDNLNIIHLLRCPISDGNLQLSDDKHSLFSTNANVVYPVINNIPVLIPSEATSL